MSSRVDPPDLPPDEGYVTFGEYAAQHGLPYNRVYDWVRWGHVAGVRHGGRWWVRHDAPQPRLRKGGWDQAERLKVIRAQRSPESWQALWRAAGRAAAQMDPARRREMGRRGGSSPKKRRNHGGCLACSERPATVKGRCARCNAYLRYRGVERPATVPRRGPQSPTGPRRRVGTETG